MISIPHLESNLTIACQNRCVACNHFVSIQVDKFKESMIDPRAFERDLRNFARVARTEIWAPIGGEPLLHPAIDEILQIARHSEAISKVEIRTNGQALRDMSEEFWTLFDSMVVTTYPGKLSDDDILWIWDQCRERVIDLEMKTPEFMRLLEPPTSPEKAARKYQACWFKTYCRVLDNGWFYRCCTSPFVPKLLLGLPEGTDGIRVDENLTEEALSAYLGQVETPKSCSVCVGMSTESTVPIPWQEISDRVRWLEESGGGRTLH